MKSITDWFRSKTTTTATESESEVAPEPETSLFQCQTCDAVFVAVEKHDCETCKSEVEPVPSPSA